MDMLSVTPASTVSSQQMTSKQSQAQATSKANGTAPFQQQLNQYVNQTGSGKSTVANEASIEGPVVIEEVPTENLTLNAEQLVALIEGLIEKIEELIDVPISDEDASALDEMSMQLLAVLQLLSVDNQSVKDLIDQFTTINSSTDLQLSENQVNNSLLFKLQEQLLMLQQTLKDGHFKVIQGQQPEQVLSQVVESLNKLLDVAKENGKGQLIKQLTNQANGDVDVIVNSLTNQTLEQLKQLAKQGEYVQLANQTSQTAEVAIPVVNQQVDSIPVVNLQGTVPFSAQLTEAVSVVKGQSQITTVNQFAETVKTMVVQKFDITQLTNGMSQARITLNPESLGSVDIKLTMQNGVLTAIFSTETAMAKDALENQMSVLRGALATQGITVERMEVTQASFNDELQWQQQRQNQTNPDTREDEENDESFEEQLEANVVNQELGFGRAVNETI